MQPITKDRGGHTDNPINNDVKGLFFMVCYAKSARSVFGPKRFLMSTYELISGCNLYFSDFYCLKVGKPHYVQIVVTIPNSDVDHKCRNLGLVQLNPYDNRFIQLSKEDNSVGCADSMMYKRNLYIEVFYAGTIDTKSFIKSGKAEFLDVCSGMYSVTAKPKAYGCDICK